MKKLKKTEAVDINGKIWGKTEIRDLLERNDTSVLRALLKIYNRQTNTEKECRETAELNSIGFTGVDANILSSMAEFYKKTGYLSVKQMNIARKKMKKYWRQLLEEIRESNPNQTIKA